MRAALPRGSTAGRACRAGPAERTLRETTPAATVAACLAVTLAAPPLTASAQDPDGAARALIARYVATFDTAALLQEPAIRRELQAVAGRRLKEIEAALSVNGGVEYIDGALAVAGNAPRQGGQTEAVVCIQPFGPQPRVHAALLRGGQVTVFTRETRWDFLTTCIRDWAALALTGRQTRSNAPAAVRLTGPR